MARGRRLAARPFASCLSDALAQVPPGRVTTYGDLARALGDVRAARAVGAILAANEDPQKLACHRVVMADGSLGGYAFGGPAAKAKALRAEGVRVAGGRVVELDSVAVRNFEVLPVLSVMATRQRELARLVRLAPLRRTPSVVIGVDAAYGAGQAVAAACAFDLHTAEPLETATVSFVPGLPYVPGYLAFREVDGVVAAVRALHESTRRGAVVLVDGQGILHPRRCGIASVVGFALSMPAVGTAKKRLVGDVAKRSRDVFGHRAFDVRVDGERRGARLGEHASGRGVFASPGTGLSVFQAVEIAARATRPGGRSPWPVEAADRACRQGSASS